MSYASPRKDGMKARSPGEATGSCPPTPRLDISRRGEGSLPATRGGGLRFRLLSPAPELKDLVHELELGPPTVTLREGREMRNRRRARGSLRPKQEVFAF